MASVTNTALNVYSGKYRSTHTGNEDLGCLNRTWGPVFLRYCSCNKRSDGKEVCQESDKVKRICSVKVSRHPAQSSTACCRLSFMFLRHLVLVLHGGWHVRIWIIEPGGAPGELVTSALYLVRQQETHRDSLVWSGLTVCSPTMSFLADSSAWHAQMSVHRRTDTRLGLSVPRRAHVRGRHAEVDVEWHPSGNQRT